jgi:hypothetical protein
MILVNHNAPQTFCPVCKTLTCFAYSEAIEDSEVIRACSNNHALKLKGIANNAGVIRKGSFYGRKTTEISRRA